MSGRMLKAAMCRRVGLFHCFVALVGFAAMASSAEASIVVININSPNVGQVNGGASAGNSVTFSNWFMANANLELHNGTSLGSRFGLDGDGDLKFAVTGTGADATPGYYSSGSTIDGTANYSSSDNTTAFQLNSSISPDFGPNSYMGMRVGSGSTWNYGWVKVLWNSTLTQFRILGAAYETTPNTAIAAGATGAVPEPTSGAMVALLLGGTALNQWRKNRRESGEENGELAS